MEDFLRLKRAVAAIAARFVLALSSRFAQWRRASRCLAGAFVVDAQWRKIVCWKTTKLPGIL